MTAAEISALEKGTKIKFKMAHIPGAVDKGMGSIKQAWIPISEVPADKKAEYWFTTTFDGTFEGTVSKNDAWICTRPAYGCIQAVHEVIPYADIELA